MSANEDKNHDFEKLHDFFNLLFVDPEDSKDDFIKEEIQLFEDTAPMHEPRILKNMDAWVRLKGNQSWHITSNIENQIRCEVIEPDLLE